MLSKAEYEESGLRNATCRTAIAKLIAVKKHCPSCLLLYYNSIILLLQENCIHSKQSFEQDSSGAFWLSLEILGSTYYYYKNPFVCQ